jgi:hypothetical protein
MRKKVVTRREKKEEGFVDENLNNSNEITTRLKTLRSNNFFPIRN